MKAVVLKPGREKSVLRRHPWIFSGALAAGEADAGEIVAVESSRGERLGYAAFSPASQIRARMLAFAPDVVPDEEFIASRVRAAVALRGKMAANAGVRLVNAENDFLPGLVADCYAGWVVLELTSAFAERFKHVVAKTLIDALPGCRGVAARCDAEVRGKEGLSVSLGLEILAGEEPPREIEIVENGMRLLIDVRVGHKTGFYLDQRAARAAVAKIASGCDVLNCFSFTGGFGIAAALNGAKSVLQIDASQAAVDLSRRNAALNGIEAIVTSECADVFKYLRSCRDAGRTFDLIVLDPPKFAESKSQIERAARGYKDINLLAMKLLRPGGRLATFSCSGAITPEFFDTILAEAATDAKRDFQIVERTGQPFDHPVALSFPEGRYLKGVVLREHGRGNSEEGV